MSRHLWSLAVGAACLLTGCRPPAPDLEAEGRALMQVSREWSSLVATGNLDSIMTGWADDAVMMAPGLPPLEGKAAIRGYVEALGDSPNADEGRRFLEIIARHTARMERLVNDLLRLARLEGGQELPDYSSCHIESLIGAVVADLQLAIDARRQRVDIRVEPAVATIVGDPAQLHDALRNLIENATIYSKEGGAIIIEARRQGDRLVLTVADEGPGIPPADVSRVFERFYRVDKARSRDSGGTGLGLAIVKHLVERMDGSVEAANRDRGGAIFTIRLPLTPTAQPVAS